VVWTLVANPAVALGIENNSVTSHITIDGGRTLLANDRVREAEQSVAAALRDGAGDDLLCLWGEIQFRRANFTEAGAAFDSATKRNPRNARAWWGLGRIEEIHFRRDRARELFAKAYGLDPRDTDIILSYLDGMPDARNRTMLLRDVISLSSADNPRRAALAVAQIQIEERLGGRAAGRLASAYTTYRVPLSGFHPASARQDGLLVAVRINGGKTLHLVLDTGARGIFVDARATKNLGLEPIVESRVAGFGAGEAAESQVALARSLAIGDLAFENCLIQVSRQSMTAGADGILGAGVFERFRMRVDVHSHAMDLTPIEQPLQGEIGRIPAIGQRNLLLVRTAVADREGWFLLDTGAAFTTLARDLVPSAFQGSTAPELVGARGAVTGAYRLGPLSLAVGRKSLVDMTPVALDLAPLSRREGIEISGVLGYAALSKGPFTIDLSRGLVTFE